MVAGHIAGITVLDVVGRVTEALPDRLAPTVLVLGALDLVRGGGAAPDESLEEVYLRHHRICPPQFAGTTQVTGLSGPQCT